MIYSITPSLNTHLNTFKKNKALKGTDQMVLQTDMDEECFTREFLTIDHRK
jgi:hypothetical protein